MRVLYASMMLPYPPTFGKRMEIWASLRALAADGHRVTLVSFDDRGQRDVDRQALSEVCEDVELVPIHLSGGMGLGGHLRRLAALPARDPYDAWRFRSPAFRECLERRLKTSRFDAVIANEVFTLQNMPPTGRVPVILKKDHLGATIWQRYVQYESNPFKRLYGALESWKTLAWETDVCRRATAITACSELERKELEQLCPGVPVTLAPNVIDLEAYTAADGEDTSTVLYSGLMDWYPNQDAVSYFVRAILPQLRALVPAVHVVVAGRSSSHAFQRRFTGVRGLEFTGTVPDMRPIIRRAAICIVPLRIGSGTRFKILEAAAMGRPAVSTRIGAEGLDFADGEEIALADEPAEFARAIAGLIADPVRRHGMGIAARRRVEKAYSFPVLCRALRAAVAGASRSPALAAAAYE